MTANNLRRFTRLTLVETGVGVLDVDSGIEFSGDGQNLSSEGLSFRATMEPAVGADMQVVLRGSDSRLAPLRATLRVLRVTPVAGGQWDVAGRLTAGTHGP